MRIDHREKQCLVSFHGYRNKYRLLPGVEVERSPYVFRVNGQERLLLQPSLMVWLQPNGFYDRTAQPGGALRVQGSYALDQTWRIVAVAEERPSAQLLWIRISQELFNDILAISATVIGEQHHRCLLLWEVNQVDIYAE